ncbi:hypothetical protein B0T13DRAFT_523103, partial [Neurospora crassa]
LSIRWGSLCSASVPPGGTLPERTKLSRCRQGPSSLVPPNLPETTRIISVGALCPPVSLSRGCWSCRLFSGKRFRSPEVALVFPLAMFSGLVNPVSPIFPHGLALQHEGYKKGTRVEEASQEQPEQPISPFLLLARSCRRYIGSGSLLATFASPWDRNTHIRTFAFGESLHSRLHLRKSSLEAGLDKRKGNDGREYMAAASALQPMIRHVIIRTRMQQNIPTVMQHYHDHLPS